MISGASNFLDRFECWSRQLYTHGVFILDVYYISRCLHFILSTHFFFVYNIYIYIHYNYIQLTMYIRLSTMVCLYQYWGTRTLATLQQGIDASCWVSLLLSTAHLTRFIASPKQQIRKPHINQHMGQNMWVDHAIPCIPQLWTENTQESTFAKNSVAPKQLQICRRFYLQPMYLTCRFIYCYIKVLNLSIFISWSCCFLLTDSARAIRVRVNMGYNVPQNLSCRAESHANWG